MSVAPTARLNDGVLIPHVGLGIFQVDPSRTVETLLTAFAAGYRHIDTAQIYGNEAEVGKALRVSGLSRDEVFITTKLDRDQHGYTRAMKGIERSLSRLGLDYVDLFLIHWPMPDENLYIETWNAFEKMVVQGKSRSIGVSNLQIGHLRRLAERTGTVPSVNQVELHHHFQQRRLTSYHGEHGISTVAWRPLAKGEMAKDPAIVRLANQYGKSPAQIVLRWQVQSGNIVIPKSVTPARIRENIDIFDFEVTPSDMDVIAGLDGAPQGTLERTNALGFPTWRP
jgi:2,5-diketo-D-gluconate reductase A